MDSMNRRVFLKYAGATVAGLPLLGAARQAGDYSYQISVRLHDENDPMFLRMFHILKDRIEQRLPAMVIESGFEPNILLKVDTSLPAEAFRIDDDGGLLGVRVSGGSPRGLLYGVGKLLRTSLYEKRFLATEWRGTSVPRGTVRGVYFATHFHNWYVQASEAEVTRYIEDLALWGVNTVMAVFPMINLQGWDDPEAEPAMAMLRRYARITKDLGLQFATGVGNTLFIGALDDIRATRLADPMGRRGNSGHPICPSNPAGHEYIMSNTRRLYEKLSDIGLDLVCYWPYDEGGCACEKCMPWGSNGFLKLSRDLTQLGREYFPNLKTVLSTWMFDTPPEGEWQGLSEALARGEDWLDYILADAHEDFPRYPLDTGVPGGRPLLNFPEISMWGNSPWGGVGANPLPARFQRLWDQVKHVVEGGFPYSEGIYEDMNKAVVAQFYWDRDQSARATLEEYINYEFGGGVAPQVLELVDLLEAAAGQSYQKQPVDADAVRRARDIAESVHGRLPDWGRANWRWEILRLRALLDHERFAGGGLQTPEAEAALLRLIDIYHCQLETDDPYHHRVRPRSKRAVSRQGEK